MPGPIVVATDFSARADRAIDRALMLGDQCGRPVVLLHAVNRRRDEVDQAELDRRMESVLPEGVEAAGTVEFAYAEGSPPHALANAADELSASLIVMGPARHNSIGDYFLGTAVDYTLRHCDQPVLIAKQRPHRFYDRIVVATDFSAPSAAALRLALDLFPEADVHLAHACHVPFEGWQQDPHVKDEIIAAEKLKMGDFLAGLENVPPERRARIKTHVVHGSAHAALKQVVREAEANLVVIGSHGESGFRHATIGSMANALLETTPVDTLMVKANG